MHPQDASAYAAGTDDAAVREHGHLPEPEYTEDTVLALIRGPIRDGLGRGDLAVLTIADPSTDDFVGSLVLFGATDTSIEVGFWIHPDHRGEHLSTAALALATEIVRRSGFTSVTARTALENVASQRALERSGYERGTSQRDTAPSGESTILMHYRRPIDPPSLFPLTTDRLRLRLHEHQDAQPLQRIYGREDVAQYLLDEPWSEPDAVRHVSERIAQAGLDDGGTKLALVIEREGLMRR
ncbi:hypothetical protein BH708_07810 [Brachybacterium sp. P6-10-X1]|nr:hypothetical protein BH708_07810 [Brachybacterium sp. P6-10-X1]